MRGFLFICTFPLLPALTALSVFVWQLLFAKTAESGLFTAGQWAFIGGFMLWAAIYFIRRRTAVSYIWAHELTHAITGLLCGAKVHRMVINRTGGFVELSKDNILITLAPYFVPFYLLLFLGLRLSAEHFFPGTIPESAWLFGIGFTFSFHILHTINALITVAQPDIQVYGRLFSYWFIAATNLIIIAAGLILFYRIAWADAFTRFSSLLALHYGAVSAFTLEVWHAAKAHGQF